ncbi:MAG: TetR/AcrR family transcriptional regulator [Chloroflexota bacterium]
MRLFWRKGYAATSVEDLTETLGLSRSSLYDTFGDKRKLFLEALKLYSERVISHAEQTLNEATSVITAVQTLFDEFIAGVGSEAGAMGCFMVNSITELVPYDPDVTAMAAAYTNALERLLTETLTRAAAQGVVTQEQTPDQLAAYVFNMIQGMRVIIKSGATREQAQAVAAITLRSLQ